MKTILCDLDGTVADLTHRLHHIQSKPKNWDAFYAACKDDGVYENIANLVKFLGDADCHIIYVSGRREGTRKDTRTWLDNNKFPPGALLMRSDGDFREDYIVKREIFERELKAYNIWFVLDDRDQVVKMWRELGLTCLQVKSGDY